jgi:hypothetical protein
MDAGAAEHGDVAVVGDWRAGGRLIGEQRGNGVAAQHIALVVDAGRIVELESGLVELIEVELAQEDVLLDGRQRLEIGLGAGRAAAIVESLLQPARQVRIVLLHDLRVIAHAGGEQR